MPVYERKDTKSKRFYYKFAVDGVTFKKNIPTARTRRQAEEAERQRRDEIHSGIYGAGKEILFEKFVKEFYLPYVKQHNEDYRHYVYMTNLLSVEFKGKTLRQIAPFTIEKLKQKLATTNTIYGEPYKPNSINRVKGCLSAVFSLAVTNGFLRENPCRKVKQVPAPPERCRILEPEEEDRLMEVLENDRSFLKPVVQLAIWTGFRMNELLDLRPDYIDFNRDLIYVVKPKWKKDKRKTEGNPIDPETKELLRSLCSREVLFMNDLEDTPLTDDVLSHAFHKACKRAGIHGLGFHGLRHTFGSRLAENGANLKHIARLMGHATTAMTERYIHPTEGGLRSILKYAKRNAAAQIRTSPLRMVNAGNG